MPLIIVTAVSNTRKPFTTALLKRNTEGASRVTAQLCET